MTGFAAASHDEAGERVHVTAKAVNHRFLDVALKAPNALAPIEPALKSRVQQRLTRGRVELSIVVDSTAPPERQVVIDQALVERLAAAVAPLRERGIVAGELSVSDLLRLPQAVDIRSRGAEQAPGTVPPELTARVERVVDEALAALVSMRETEGRILERDLTNRLATVGGFVDDLERLARAGQERLAIRLRERLAQLPADLTADAAALSQEVVRFVARSDVDEEVVRLRGHVEHWRALAAAPEPCGRKLDFLVQEMNREVNTIGAKVEGARATEVVIAAKAELERIREQVQNVE
jgi:uncharacterized protein (TIGR00255 family)